MTIQQYIDRFEMTRFLSGTLIDHLRCFTFEAYSAVLTEQSSAKYLYFLVDGQLQCTHFHANGKAAVLALSEPFTAIGDLEVLTDRPIASSVVATRPSTLLGIPTRIVNRYGADDPRLLRFLLDEVRAKMIESNAVQLSHVLPVAARLSLYVLARTNTNGPGKESMTIELPGRDSLASLLGTTTRHLNRIIRQLNDDGALEVHRRRLIVRDAAALESIVER